MAAILIVRLRALCCCESDPRDLVDQRLIVAVLRRIGAILSAALVATRAGSAVVATLFGLEAKHRETESGRNQIASGALLGLPLDTALQSLLRSTTDLRRS